MNRMIAPMLFSRDEKAGDDKKRSLINVSIDLTKTELENKRIQDNNFLINKYSVNNSLITTEVKKAFRNKLYKYCAEKAGLTDLDFEDKNSMMRAFSHPVFEWELMSIITETINTVNADNEVEDILVAANVKTVGIGDSFTDEIESKSLYKVQEHAYGDNKSRYQEHLKSPITITPLPKSASVDFDVIQMTAINYDWGKQIAKIAASFRTKMYQDVVDVIFTVANVSATPFYAPTFAKSTYVTLASRLEAANGGAGVTAYGTNIAFTAMSDIVDTGYTTLDEINKSGFIGNLYGVRTQIFKQAVDSSNANFAFRVPNDRVLLMSSLGERPVKLVKESALQVISETGLNTALYKRVYTMIDSWKAQLATQAAYAIQEV